MRNRAQVSVHDDVFSLGGNSMSAFSMVASARAHGYVFTVLTLNSYPTVRMLAAAVASEPCEDEVLNTEGAMPLCCAQHWFFEQSFHNPSHFNQSSLLSIAHDDKWQPTAALPQLQKALHALSLHHPALRIGFEKTPQGWIQYQHGTDAAELAFPLEYFDVLLDTPPEQHQNAVTTQVSQLAASLR